MGGGPSHGFLHITEAPEYDQHQGMRLVIEINPQAQTCTGFAWAEQIGLYIGCC